MSHHFDTATTREDPRINICDVYLFRGAPRSTVMALTVNPDAGLSAPDTYRDEGIYAFRFDLDGDAREDVTFKILFGPVTHAEGDAHRHIQPFEVRRATGGDARRGADGALLIAGEVGRVAESNGVMAFAGLAPDLFAGDAVALRVFRNAILKENRFAIEAWQNRKNFFARRNVTAIVLEIPNDLIGRGRVNGWATVSLYGHAPEVQVCRWGLPLLTNIFIPDEAIREVYNRTGPADDATNLGPHIAEFAAKVSGLARSAADPSEYGRQVAERLCPVMLPCEVGTEAAFDFASVNGRGLTDDVMDVMLTLVSNTALGDGVAPDKSRVRGSFPYFGPPYSPDEQIGLAPVGKSTTPTMAH